MHSDYCHDCGEEADDCVCDWSDEADFVSCPEGVNEDHYYEGLRITGDHDLAISYAYDMSKDD